MSLPVGDGVADDTAALAEAIKGAATAGVTLHLRPRATYRVTSEILIPRNVDIDGHGASIDAYSPMRSVLNLRATAYIKNLTVNGGRVAEHALLCDGAGESFIQRSTFMMAVKDAARLAGGAPNGGNDCMVFERCKFQHSGRLFQGSLTCTGGSSAAIQGTDTQFVTWGLRPGDFLYFAGKHWPVAKVISETEAQLGAHPNAPEYSGAFTLGIGNGYREESDHDNNLVVLRECLTRGNAGSGARFAGLFGSRVQNHRSDFNGDFGMVVGLTGDTSNVIVSQFLGTYTEGNGGEQEGAFWLGYAAGIEVLSINCGGPPVFVANPSFNWGTVSNAQGRPNVGSSPIGNSLTDLPSREFFVFDTPPEPRHGRIAFKYAPAVGDFIGWVCLGQSWFPFGKVGA